MNRYNNFWIRLGAVIIDSIVLAPLTFIDAYSVASTNKVVFCIGIFISSFIYTAYFIILHARCGQTLGKKLMKIKVLDIDEVHLISIKRAIMRELPWIVSTIGILLYLTITVFLTSNSSLQERKEDYDNLTFIVSFSWIFIELITMLRNYKRRALHDYLANSVIIKTSA